jgi:N utilization substance protein B
MISRRLIRIKVLKILFAYLNSTKTIENAEKELMFSIDKTYELYRHLLWLPVAIADCAAQQIEIGKQKVKPTPEERNPNTKFVGNLFVQMLRQHPELQKFTEKNNFKWQPDVVKKIYRTLKDTPYYQQYMQRDERSFGSDKMLIIKLLETEIEDQEDLYASLEEQSIYWIDDIEYALSHAIKSCRTFIQNGKNQLYPQYKDELDEQVARKLFSNAVLYNREYRQIIKKHAENWGVERIVLMDIVIMVTAIAELLTFESIPVSVTLNEYIEIAKYYSTPQSSNFINGILDKIVVELIEQKRINKYYGGMAGVGREKST